MMRDVPLLLILDEPTASLDAITEAALFERYLAARRQASEVGGDHAAGVAPVLHGADGRPDRGTRQGPDHGERRP